NTERAARGQGRQEGLARLALRIWPRPGVAEEIALWEGVGRVDEHLRDAGDPSAATDRRNDRGPVADCRLRDDAAVERRSDHGGMQHRVADAEVAARVQRRHPCGEAGAGRAAIEPTWSDDDSILRDAADAPPRLGDLDDAHTCDLGVLRMHAW